MRARGLQAIIPVVAIAIYGFGAGSGCSQLSVPAPHLHMLPRPTQRDPQVVFGERSAKLIGAYTEKLEACFVMEDATLAALHRRQDVAEEVAAFYVETDADGLPVRAKIKHCFSDGGAHWSLWTHASWNGDEWRVWREPGLEYVEPPAARERMRVL